MALVLTSCQPVDPAPPEPPPPASLVSEQVGRTTPFVKDGRVEAIAKIGDIVVVGGSFTRYKDYHGAEPEITDQPYLFAYKHSTGEILSDFAPQVSGPVYSLVAAPDSLSVFVGGALGQTNGVYAGGLVKLDLFTGARDTSFATRVHGLVADVDLSGDRMFVAGVFNQVNDVERTHFAALDVASGEVDQAFDLPLTGYYRNPYGELSMDVTPAGDRLVIAGNFNTVNGEPRDQIAQVDLTTNSLTPWSTDVFPQPTSGSRNTYLMGVDYSPDGSYFAVAASCCTGNHFDSATRFETAGGPSSQPTWQNNTGYDSLTAVAVTEAAVYVGGHQKWLDSSRSSGAVPGSVDRPGLAALDPETGVALNWNPGRQRGHGVLTMEVTDEGMFIGHDTNIVSGEYRPRVTFFPFEGGVVPPPDEPVDLPAQLWSVDRSTGATTVRDYDGTDLGEPQPGAQQFPGTTAAFVIADRLYTGTSNGELLRWQRDGATWVNPVDVNARDDWAVGSPVNWAAIDGAAYTQDALLLHNGNDENDVARVPIASESMLYGYDRSDVAAPVGDWGDTTSHTIVGDQILWITDAGDLWRASQVDGEPVPGTQSLLGGPTVDGTDYSNQVLFATTSA